MFASIVVGTDGSETAHEAVRQAVALARQLGARLDIVSAYEPVPAGRLREEAEQVPDDLQWIVNPREDVDATLRAAAEESQAAGVPTETYARQGDPADAILDVAEERGADAHRGRQQGDDRRQALPAGLGAEQDQPPRALQRADHPDEVGTGDRVPRSAAAASTSPAP